MTDLEEAIHHLLWVWAQYGHGSTMIPDMDKVDPDMNKVELVHFNMQAGELASDFLERHGYGEDQGYSFVVNQKGCALMMKDFQ